MTATYQSPGGESSQYNESRYVSEKRKANVSVGSYVDETTYEFY
jgi:hypothetical protein